MLRKKELIALAGLEGKEKQFAGTMSGVRNSSLALACALLHRPPLLFLMNLQPVWTPCPEEFGKYSTSLLPRELLYLLLPTIWSEADQCHRLGFMHQGG